VTQSNQGLNAASPIFIACSLLSSDYDSRTEDKSPISSSLCFFRSSGVRVANGNSEYLWNINYALQQYKITLLLYLKRSHMIFLLRISPRSSLLALKTFYIEWQHLCF